MASRIELNEELVSLLGSRNVYFQPPETIRMKYPCIIYMKSNVRSRYADNVNYASMNEYTLTVVDRDPDSDIADRLLRRFPFCSFSRRYTAENLYHDVLTLYY